MSILLTDIASIIESETEGGYLEHWCEFKSGLATEQQQDYFLGIAKSISGKIREVVEGFGLRLERGGILSDVEVEYYNRGAKAQLQLTLKAIDED